jgi:hypothetical protein
VSNHGRARYAHRPNDNHLLLPKRRSPRTNPLTDGRVAEAVVAIQQVFHISDGLYTRAEIFRDNELVETVENACSAQVASILIQ